MKVKVTKTIHISKEYDDIENIEDARKYLDLDIEADQFALLIACYFKSNKSRVKWVN